MSKTKILVVEDDPELVEVVCRYLREFGYQSETAQTSREVFEHLPQVSLVILDLQLPQDDGLEILREIRRRSNIPVLITTGRTLGTERIVGLEMGADDYLCKPFLPREMVARVKALLRRSGGGFGRSEAITVNGISLDEKRRSAVVEGKEVHFSHRQFTMLRILAENPGKTFEREELLTLVWGVEASGEARKVDLMVSKVRTKLADEGIELDVRSVWGVGYEFLGVRTV